MPAAFENCVKRGGKVRRVTGPSKRWKVPAGSYRNICFLKSGKTYKGHLHKIKKRK